MASRVEKPPWKTLDPMALKALLTLYSLFYLFVTIDAGGITVRYL